MVVNRISPEHHKLPGPERDETDLPNDKSQITASANN